MSTFVFGLVVVVGTAAVLLASGPGEPFKPATEDGWLGRGELEPPRPTSPPEPASAPPPPPPPSPPAEPVAAPPSNTVLTAPAPPRRVPAPGVPERVSAWRRLRSAIALVVLLAFIGVVVAGALATVLYLVSSALHHAANSGA